MIKKLTINGKEYEVDVDGELCFGCGQMDFDKPAAVAHCKAAGRRLVDSHRFTKAAYLRCEECMEAEKNKGRKTRKLDEFMLKANDLVMKPEIRLDALFRAFGLKEDALKVAVDAMTPVANRTSILDADDMAVALDEIAAIENGTARERQLVIEVEEGIDAVVDIVKPPDGNRWVLHTINVRGAENLDAIAELNVQQLDIIVTVYNEVEKKLKELNG